MWGTLAELRKQRDIMVRADNARRLQAECNERQRLRDQFAAAALTGLIARPEFDDDPLDYRYMCGAAYKWADAMMLVRQAKPPEVK